MLGRSSAVAVGTLVVIGLAGCGGTTATTAVAPKPVELRAPNCTHEPTWTVELDIAGVSRVASVNGVPSLVGIDDATRSLEVEDVETRKVTAKAKLPVAENVNLYPLEILETPTGTVVLVSASTYSEDDEQSEYSYYLVRFDAANQPSVEKLQLTLEDSFSASVIAVGDHFVFTTARDYNMDTDATQMYVGVFDKTGKLVHELDEPSTESIIPVGPTTFAVHAKVTSGHTVLRVFDTKRLDWAGPALPLTQSLQDWVSLGGRAILAGFDPDDDDTGLYQVSLAALDETGTLAPWQPLGIEADTVEFAARPDGSALVVARDGQDQLHLFAVGPDLKVLPGAAPVPAPAAGIGMTPHVRGDHLYVDNMRKIERYSCK